MNFSKIKDKINLPIILFFIILINFIPLIIPNMVSKESHGVGVVPMAFCFAVECILIVAYMFIGTSAEQEFRSLSFVHNWLNIVSSIVVAIWGIAQAKKIKG